MEDDVPPPIRPLGCSPQTGTHKKGALSSLNHGKCPRFEYYGLSPGTRLRRPGTLGVQGRVEKATENGGDRKPVILKLSSAR